MATKSDITPELCRQLLAYDPDTGALVWRRRDVSRFPGMRENWNTKHAGRCAMTTIKRDPQGHVICFIGTVLNTPQKAHRLAWAIHYGAWPAYQIDHINGDPLDNRIANLRDVPQRVNSRNAALPKDNKSGVIGVCWNNKTQKWLATIKTAPGRQKYLGDHAAFDEAVAARRAAEVALGYHVNHGRESPY